MCRSNQEGKNEDAAREKKGTGGSLVPLTWNKKKERGPVAARAQLQGKKKKGSGKGKIGLRRREKGKGGFGLSLSKREKDSREKR